MVRPFFALCDPKTGIPLCPYHELTAEESRKKYQFRIFVNTTENSSHFLKMSKAAYGYYYRQVRGWGVSNMGERSETVLLWHYYDRRKLSCPVGLLVVKGGSLGALSASDRGRGSTSQCFLSLNAGLLPNATTQPNVIITFLVPLVYLACQGHSCNCW